MDLNNTFEKRASTHGEYLDVVKCSQETKDLWRTQEGWSRLSGHQKETLEMIAHKVGRILAGDPNTPDHWHDLAGYAVLTHDRLGK